MSVGLYGGDQVERASQKLDTQKGTVQRQASGQKLEMNVTFACLMECSKANRGDTSRDLQGAVKL